MVLVGNPIVNKYFLFLDSRPAAVSKNTYKSSNDRYVPTFDIEGLLDKDGNIKRSNPNVYSSKPVSDPMCFGGGFNPNVYCSSKIHSYDSYKYFGDKYNDYQPPIDEDFAPRVKRGFMGTEVPRRGKKGKGGKGRALKGGPNAFEKFNPNEGEPTYPCSNCGRRFVQSSLMKHQRICARVFNKSRRQFDSFYQRAKDMEAGYQRSYQDPYKKVYRRGDMPKWKQESLEFRRVLRENRHLKVSEPWGGGCCVGGGMGGGYGGMSGGWGMGGGRIGADGSINARDFYGRGGGRGYGGSTYGSSSYGGGLRSRPTNYGASKNVSSKYSKGTKVSSTKTSMSKGSSTLGKKNISITGKGVKRK